MLNKARALYLVRVSVTCEIIDRREKGGVGGPKIVYFDGPKACTLQFFVWYKLPGP